MANFKDALLDGVEPKAEAKAAPKAPVADETATVAEAPKTAPKTVAIAPKKDKIYYAIGLKNYSTIIAGLPVFVEAGKPWQGTKYQYDVLKRAKLIQ